MKSLTLPMLAALMTLLWLAHSPPALKAASPPGCETKPLGEDGGTIDICHRADTTCASLAVEQVKRPSPSWNGCFWGAAIDISHPKFRTGTACCVSLDSNSVLLVPSFRDSDRMDVVVTVQFEDHSSKTYEYEDVPIIIRDNIPRATVDYIPWSRTQSGVPTVKAKEKGGAIEVTHSYD